MPLSNLCFDSYDHNLRSTSIFVHQFLRETVLRLKLIPGDYVIIPHTLYQNQQGDFVLRVFSEKSHGGVKPKEESSVHEEKALATYEVEVSSNGSYA